MSPYLKSELTFQPVGLVQLAVSIGRFVVRTVLRVRMLGHNDHRAVFPRQYGARRLAVRAYYRWGSDEVHVLMHGLPFFGERFVALIPAR
jgi:hypothetical protein